MAKKRNTPLYVVDGTVKIYAPTSLEGKSKYFRVVYLCDGRQKDTTAKTEALAKSIAGKIARGLKHGGAFKFQLSGSELINAYLDPAVREVSGRAWGPKHSLAQRSLLNMYVRPVIGNLACSEITNDLI